jgi:hypothetical protein
LRLLAQPTPTELAKMMPRTPTASQLRKEGRARALAEKLTLQSVSSPSGFHYTRSIRFREIQPKT